ncbi:catalase [Pseudoduganella sp. FT26W]|uniref:Catalase n=1 Tax=Duganella aquatilis TaxID=2666082 RepID=A0A844DF24_9BURK|nr:catalase family protein [Duganella aquatilis]MRW87010.1 catalase [Duganella aquatilis]
MDFPTRHLVQPLPYDPSYEVPEEGEADTIAGLTDAMRGIADTVDKDTGHAPRGVHAKSHGLLRGELRVLDNVPPDYAQGLFGHPGGAWPVVMRLSTTPGDLLDDKVSTPRGMAVKVIGVPGERLPDGVGDTTQDFVLVNGPTFQAPSAKQFLGSVKLLASTTDKAPGLKKALSAALRGVEKAVEAVGGESAALKGLGGHPETHILGETFFSAAPILYGRYMAKLSLAPVSPALQALKGQPVDLEHKPNGLRGAVVDFMTEHSAEWELRVQLCTDLAAMPIEDSTVEWTAPWVAVARIKAEPQAGWTHGLSVLVDDGMQFNPWHCIAAFRPIGSIMRVRRAVYAASARFRTERNGAPLAEPRNLDHWREH